MAHHTNTMLGERLVDAGIISEQALNNALEVQKRTGAKLGKVLVAEGRLNNLKLYSELAEQQGQAFADLVKTPASPSLIEKAERQTYFELEALPWKKEGNATIIATPEITDQVQSWAGEKYDEVRYVITSPYDIYWNLREYFAELDDDIARNLLWKEDPESSARNMFSGFKSVAVMLPILLLVLTYFFFDTALLALLLVINAFYATTLLFKLAIFTLGGIEEKRHAGKDDRHLLLSENDLPIYTLLIPLFKEQEITISTLISSIRRLDYPLSKLDIKLIVEEGDKETINVIKALKCERIFEIIRVPYSLPQTKPKACNYALRFAKGKYVTIYDAEDIPDPAQLKKVVRKFMDSDPFMVCVQARLNYYNKDENTLTRMFAIEYSSWFDFMLRGLEILKLPIPLGGTSNHFPVRILKDLYAWDPYNVTEDADLGIRLAQYGYRASILDSTTMEEAPITLINWLKQRTRWIKGYMQTWLVHMKRPRKLIESLGWHGVFGFVFFVGAPCIVFITIPLVIIATAAIWLNDMTIPGWLMQFALANFFASVVVHTMIAAVVLLKQKWMHMLPYSAVFPFYWILHIVASFRALWQLIVRPYYWDKTEHGSSTVLSTLSTMQKSHSLLDKQKGFM